ncbi:MULTISPECIES: nuclear transport factor 2 family protein [Rhodococcus]|uniref:Nuclear transport factor 2 family protein n=1 Tax=Rhodococcus oxybenzonivorans TaxID=1990687 RepID=A0AAE4UXC0_9NOCA|nr:MULTISPECIES: nuclear transport factor 2 family protein [Rhodococcus]MDV7241733.1 nuclear transport factor 2 family protein [Rhodococcus oxybenzonivorans]MDV7264656.1 nuclear transport factor 2 family protein [Rhodococcus oxybenzonivorans]MDV7273733.1 nuclear transport factor 2 family protein [Rhodococcus oxybenzonivorans]MDV7334015.1 nuclear transport factor 2 family protein [Rhodococcus oxybenzonivorans]MDV7343434.1 nuclear transport factor 2 family protein [Rhodococcus oxybenzonivorans]
MTSPNVLGDSVAAIKAEILTLEDTRYDAVIGGDFELFAALCHPDLTYSHSDGSRDTVESYLRKCRDKFYVYHRIDHPVVDVLVHGDVVVVVGEMNAAITANGTDKELANNSIAVWTRYEGAWKLLAYQPTPRR